MKQGIQLSECIERYLKTIAELANENDPVPVTCVARHLGISTVSVSEMVHRLQDQGLLLYTPYKGIQLTEDGHRRANHVIRRHRLWERFLAGDLGVPWEHVHELSCELGHAADNQIAEALADHLGHPATCPHGNPIPSVEGELPPGKGTPLGELMPGQKGTILRIHPENTVILERIARLGLKPGRKIEITEIAPFNGPITLRLSENISIVGREAASHILIEPFPHNREVVLTREDFAISENPTSKEG
jgi:DtxR family transcriptional regulator, Mn-dependent transcriptional regulator